MKLTMKHTLNFSAPQATQDQAMNAAQAHSLHLVASLDQLSKKPVTQFGDCIDVRNRGALRISRFAGSQLQSKIAPAVVRLWSDDQCRELTSHQARAIAAQLLAAALLADAQNGH